MSSDTLFTSTSSVRPWHSLTPIWTGSAEEIKGSLPADRLSPLWQVLVLGDGSPTRFLELLTGRPTQVEVLAMDEVQQQRGDPEGLADILGGTGLRRQVWLQHDSQTRLAYATSWWNRSQVSEYLKDGSLPIWQSLVVQKIELHRDIQKIYCGQNADLEKAFGYPGPFWGRHYVFWHKGEPLTLIYEVFSPLLQRYLGPVGSQAASL